MEQQDPVPTQMAVLMTTVCAAINHLQRLVNLLLEMDDSEDEDIWPESVPADPYRISRGSRLSATRRACFPPYCHSATWISTVGLRCYRSLWVEERSSDWWQRIVVYHWSDRRWIRFFRMSRSTFYEIVDIISPRLARQTTQMRQPVPVDKRLAIALYYLSGKTTFDKTGEQFGVGCATAGNIVLEVCWALKAELLEKTICLGPSVGAIMDGFAALGFPHCIGAVDGSHIRICNPTGCAADYVNRKNFCSILLQGTVDHTGRFIDAEIGWSGKNHDAFVFRFSYLFKSMHAGVYVPGNPSLNLGGVRVPPVLLGDAAYPIRPWLMRPYSTARNQRQRYFNKSLCRARNVVERAFGRLKSRWGCLQHRLDVSLENVKSVVCACVILHNICEAKGHEVLGDLPRADPLREPGGRRMHSIQADNRAKAAGERVRDALAEFMFQNRLR